jgi:hypothetical protein
MFNNDDPLKENKLKFLKFLIILLPVIGCIPAAWTLYKSSSTSEEKKISRVSVNLAIAWLITYILLSLSAGNTSDLISFRLMYLNVLITSGYFITSIVFMISIWRGKLPNLPQISKKNVRKF